MVTDKELKVGGELKARIETLDVLRGFALFGILMVNLPIFGLISAEVANPLARGPVDGITYACWWITYVFFDTKFVSIFSMLFGAGIVLMWQRGREKGASVWKGHYSRMFWLLLIGLVHAHVFWHGDILVVYALCGSIVYWFIGLKPRTLIGLGILFYLIGCGFFFLLGHTVPRLPEADLAETIAMWTPTKEMIQSELAIYRGDWLQQMPHRVKSALELQTILFLFHSFWKSGGLMLLGVALYKAGVLSGKKGDRFYLIGSAVGVLLGIFATSYGVYQIERHDWGMLYTQFFGFQYNWLASPIMAFGYICLVCLLCRRDLIHLVRIGLKAVGRMSLTNYLMQTLVCTLFFYGHGFGWYGYLSRVQLLFLLFAIWSFQLFFSVVWLNRFRYGPMEWVWRSLSQWRFLSISRN